MYPSTVSGINFCFVVSDEFCEYKLNGNNTINIILEILHICTCQYFNIWTLLNLFKLYIYSKGIMIFHLRFFHFMVCNAIAGARIRKTNISRTFIKKVSTTLPNSFSSVLNNCTTHISQVCQKAKIKTAKIIASPIPIRKVLSNIFLQKIILSFSITYFFRTKLRILTK